MTNSSSTARSSRTNKPFRRRLDVTPLFRNPASGFVPTMRRRVLGDRVGRTLRVDRRQITPGGQRLGWYPGRCHFLFERDERVVFDRIPVGPPEAAGGDTQVDRKDADPALI